MIPGPLLLLLWLAAPVETAPVVVNATSVDLLRQALADRATDIIHLPLDAATVKAEAEALRAWVEAGGTLWCGTDALTLFGFQVAGVSEAERPCHGRRAAPVGAMPELAGVTDIYAWLPRAGVLLTGHPAAIPLVRLADPVRVYNGPRYLAAQLNWRRGQVIARPPDIAAGRGQGSAFNQNLARRCRRLLDEVLLPLETLQVAQQRLQQAGELLARKPDEAKALLNQVFLAWRLWYADHLTAIGELDKALAILGGIAQELPEDPAVYLAVARLNEALDRLGPAQAAREKAAEGYARQQRTPPGPDAKALRVPWAVFAESINAVGRAWETPTKANVDEAIARTNFLVGLDHYRRGALTAAGGLWTEAARRWASWPLPAYYLGLLHFEAGSDLTAASRARAASFRQASAWFTRAAAAEAGAEFDAAALDAARAWRASADAAATAAAAEPPAVERRGGILLRYDDADQRLQRGPLKETLLQGFDGAWRQVCAWGVLVEDVEVLVYDDTAAMNRALPQVGMNRQAFPWVASGGRRVYTATMSRDLYRTARHQLAHVFHNALTEGGLPAPLWFVEGLAWSLQEHPAEADTARINLRRGRTMAISQINDPAVFYDPRWLDHSWGQAQLMATAALQARGPGLVVQLYQACGWGTPPDTAFARLTGLTQEQFLTAFLQGTLPRG